MSAAFAVSRGPGRPALRGGRVLAALPRADYPVSTLPTEGARVVARALQKYGMILADGGTIP